MDTLILTNQPAPDFTLPDLAGNPHSLSAQRGRLVVVNFWSAECPHSARTDRLLLDYMVEWGDRVQLMVVASNADEQLDTLRNIAAQRGLPLVLHDAGAEVADRYQALTTPHCYLVDAAGILRYQGGFDDVRFGQPAPSQHYLHQAVAAVLAGQQPQPAETPAFGCTIVRYA